MLSDQAQLILVLVSAVFTAGVLLVLWLELRRHREPDLSDVAEKAMREAPYHLLDR
jgi:1,2-phenylacetyl-CoA epoxidase catalytic subunit